MAQSPRGAGTISGRGNLLATLAAFAIDDPATDLGAHPCPEAELALPLNVADPMWVMHLSRSNVWLENLYCTIS